MQYFELASLISDMSQRYETVKNDDGTITLKPRILPAGKLDSDASTFKMDGDNSELTLNDIALEIAQDLHNSELENAWKAKPKRKTAPSTVKRVDSVDDAVSCYRDSMESAWSR